jgi:hypothetical protein
VPIIEPAIPTNMEDCDSSQDSGNELLGLQHHHFNALHANICLESKMDALHTPSETSSIDKEVSAEASTSSIPPNDNPVQSPPPSSTTIRKKKGAGKRRRPGATSFHYRC